MRAFVLVTLAACFTTPPPPNRPPNVADCTALAQALCMVRDRCTGGYANLRDYVDEPTCEARNLIPCLDNSQILNTGQTTATSQACSLEMGTESCTDFHDDNSPANCAPPGPGATGSPCGLDSECQSRFCALTNNDVCATCQPLPAPGTPCATQGDCGRDLACALPTGTTTGVCAPFMELSAPCITNIMPCQAVLSCMNDDPATMTPGTCVAPAMLGQGCDSSRKTFPSCDSTSGLACVGNPTMMPPDICVLAPLVAARQPCGSFPATGPITASAQCADSGLCVKQNTTDRAGICMAAAADGEACDTNVTIGPSCLMPAKCVTSGGGTAGTCQLADARMCN